MTEADITRMKEQQALRTLESIDGRIQTIVGVRLTFQQSWKVMASVVDGPTHIEGNGATLLEAFAQLAQVLEAQ